MLHNPDDYPEPEEFNPDRFMENGSLNRGVRDPSTMAFGFGRRYVTSPLLNIVYLPLSASRICPGRYFAKDNVFLTIASVLHVFDIVPAVDENGKEVDRRPNATTGLVSYVLFWSIFIVASD